MNELGDTGHKLSGPGFENALRTCLLSGVILLDTKSGFATLTREASQILGLSSDSNIQLPIENLPPSLRDIARHVLAAGKPSSSQQVTIPTRLGTTNAHVSAVPLNTVSGNSTAVLTLLSINSNAQFIRQIRQLDRLANTGTLAAGMAHEIKNALVAGRTFLDLLLEKNTDAELVQIVRRETGRIDAIVSRILRFTSASTGSFKPLHLHEVLDHAVRLVQPQISSKSIVFERSFRAASDSVKGDEYELQQAFVNLLLNSLEAMDDKASLIVLTDSPATRSQYSAQLHVVVQDTGAGILPEHMEHLFEPFFTTKDSGTGLGLAITRRIIEEHGGSISAASTPGQGTSFTVLLPLLLDTTLGGLTDSTNPLR